MQTQCDNEHLSNWPTWTLLQISFLDLLQTLSNIFLEYELQTSINPFGSSGFLINTSKFFLFYFLLKPFLLTKTLKLHLQNYGKMLICRILLIYSVLYSVLFLLVENQTKYLQYCIILIALILSDSGFLNFHHIFNMWLASAYVKISLVSLF